MICQPTYCKSLKMVRIIGIDPGLQNTGWAIIESHGSSIKFIGAGTINTKAGDDLAQRLLIIHNELKVIIERYSPAKAAIEDTYVNKNFASSLKLAHARAAAMLTLSLGGMVPKAYPAKVIKRAVTGSGKAEKDQVAYMLKCLVPASNDLSKDAADALAIAICHSHYHDHLSFVA